MTTPSTIPQDLTVTMHGGARTVLQNVRKMIDTAYMWVQDPANWRELYVPVCKDCGEGRSDPGAPGICAAWHERERTPLAQLRNEQEQYRRLLDKVTEMRRSFYERFADVIGMSGTEVEFWWDSDQSLTWQAGGLFGGLIFHAEYAKKGTERLPIGTWSLHT